MNEFLRREGFLVLSEKNSISKPDSISTLRKFAVRTCSPKTISVLKRWAPGWVVSKFSNRALEISYISRLMNAIDWEQTKAFAIGGDTFRIYTNSRRPQETSPGTPTRAEVISEILAAFRKAQIVYQDRGLRFEAYERDAIYSGNHLEDAPDLCVEVYERDVKCQTSGEVYSESLFGDAPLGFEGIHRKEGFWCVTGRDVCKGAQVNAKITDIAPTVYWLLGIPIPPDVDGTPIMKAFDRNTRPTYDTTKAEIPQTAPSAEEEDQTKVLERLRALGYLG
jgi:predicted AlkP superfamily phosphohydrolase/phosphomutase